MCMEINEGYEKTKKQEDELTRVVKIHQLKQDKLGKRREDLYNKQNNYNFFDKYFINRDAYKALKNEIAKVEKEFTDNFDNFKRNLSGDNLEDKVSKS
jgi:hypothetical protein